jgi:hypothetical protein
MCGDAAVAQHEQRRWDEGRMQNVQVAAAAVADCSADDNCVWGRQGGESKAGRSQPGC